MNDKTLFINSFLKVIQEIIFRKIFVSQKINDFENIFL